MSPEHDTIGIQADLLNCCYMVRLYRRGARSNIGRLQRQQAIVRLGASLRRALEHADDPQSLEAIFTALVDGLKPFDEQRF